VQFLAEYAKTGNTMIQHHMGLTGVGAFIRCAIDIRVEVGCAQCGAKQDDPNQR